MAIEKYKVMEQNNELVFKNTSNDLLYNENEILEKISRVKSTNLDVFVEETHEWTDRTNLTLNKDIIVNRNVDGLKIYSNNGLVYHIYTSFNANNIWANWLFEIVKKFDNDQKEISNDVKSFFEKNENIFNCNYEEINNVLNHNSFKHPTQSKRKIIEIINNKFKTEADAIFINIQNSRHIDKNIFNNYSEEIYKLVLQKIKNSYEVIREKNLMALSIPILIILMFLTFKFNLLHLTILLFFPLHLTSIIVTHEAVYNDDPEYSLFKFIKYKRILHMLEKTLSHTNSLNNNNLETQKEDIPVRKEIYLKSLKECIKLMTENPNIDWTIEKEKIKILTDGYIEIKKTSKLDSYLLLQKYPNFISELCDLEISIKDKIKDIQNKETYEEDAEEITTLLDNIQTPKMQLKLSK